MGKIKPVDENADGSKILLCPASATSHNHDCSNDLSNILDETQAIEKTLHLTSSSTCDTKTNNAHQNNEPTKKNNS